MTKRLCKSKKDAKFSGVCAGIARYFNIDPTLVRLIWVIFLFTGSGFLAYFVCMIIMPEETIEPTDSSYDPQHPYEN